LKISAEFIVSAAGPRDFSRDGLAEIAMIGRSNVGKSSLINALVRQKIARTSAEPGKTRLVNVYRVVRGSSAPFYLVDLPGYGYARGTRGSNRATAAAEFAALTEAYFGPAGPVGQAGAKIGRADFTHASPALPGSPGRPVSALLLVDVRHPGLENDRAAWQWLHRTAPAAIVGTKIDKLARGERIRALRALESVFEDSVLPVSAVTREGLDELWKLIDRLANSQPPQPPHRSSTPLVETAPPPSMPRRR
jgi:GTP-binding protein